MTVKLIAIPIDCKLTELSATCQVFFVFFVFVFVVFLFSCLVDSFSYCENKNKNKNKQQNNKTLLPPHHHLAETILEDAGFCYGRVAVDDGEDVPVSVISYDITSERRGALRCHGASLAEYSALII